MSMICAACGATDQLHETCGECGSTAALDGRYSLVEVLGRHGANTTYRAVAENGDEVVVKELRLRATESLKEISLFEREAAILERLDHPGIPRHIEHFEHVADKTVSLYNVQAFVDGKSLEHELRSSRFTESSVLEIIATVADILDYLRAQTPVVIHRDIKPDNLIRTPDGNVVLVDFGAARAVAETIHAAGSTVTGTFGYMAPEQLLGHVEPATDVYGLGATAIRLLTGREPHELLGDERRFAWRDKASVSPATADLVDTMTAHAPDDRPGDLGDLARAAASAADGQTRQLVRFRNESALQSADRPTVTGALLAASRHPKGLHFLLFALGTPLTLLLTVAIYQLAPSLTRVWTPFLYLFLGFAGLPFFAGHELFAPVPLYLTMRRGTKTRALVTDRTNEKRKFELHYRFTTPDGEFSQRRRVTPEAYFDSPPGREVTVYYDPRSPERSFVVEPPKSD